MSLNEDGSPGELKTSIGFTEAGNVSVLTYEYNQNLGLTIAIVDSVNTLHLVSYSGKSNMTTQILDNIKHATLTNGLLFCLSSEEQKFFVRDLTKSDDDKHHDFEEGSSINFINNNTMVIFSGD